MHTFKDASKTSALHSLSFGHTSFEIQKTRALSMYSKTLPISHHLYNDTQFTLQTSWIGEHFCLQDSYFVYIMRISHCWMTRLLFTTGQLVIQPNHLTKQHTYYYTVHWCSVYKRFLKQNHDFFLLSVYSSPRKTAELNVCYSKHHIS